MRRIAPLIMAVWSCNIPYSVEYVGRKPIIPDYQLLASQAPEWDWLPTTRQFGAQLYSVVVSRRKMLELTNGISAWGVSLVREPYVYFVRDDVVGEPQLLCKVSIHEMTHLMLLYETGNADPHHCDKRWQQLMSVQWRICGDAETTANQTGRIYCN